MEYKTCTKCGKELEATVEFFYKQKDGIFGLRPDCKFCVKTRNKIYQENNKEYCSKMSRKYRKGNLEHFKEYEKNYYQLNKENQKESRKKYRESEVGREVQRISRKKYYLKNRETLLENKKKYNQTEVGKGVRRKACRKDYKKNKLSRCIAWMIRDSLKKDKNGLHWETLVDYTLPELKLHLENQFKDDMSWDNYGEWHIDHKKPIALFNIVGYECDDFKECWALENLQPLWASENCSKGAKYEY